MSLYSINVEYVVDVSAHCRVFMWKNGYSCLVCSLYFLLASSICTVER